MTRYIDADKFVGELARGYADAAGQAVVAAAYGDDEVALAAASAADMFEALIKCARNATVDDGEVTDDGESWSLGDLAAALFDGFQQAEADRDASADIAEHVVTSAGEILLDAPDVAKD